MSKAKRQIPKLRFPEFRNEGSWDLKTLGEITVRIEEKVKNKRLTTGSISAGLGFVSQEEKFSRDISGTQYKNYIVLSEGEFSYNKGNSKRFPQGCICKLKEFKQIAVPNAFISFRFKPNFIGDFYQGYFDNNYHGVQLRKFITSGARMDGLLNIKAYDFFGIVLPTPSTSEQQKIASCLSALDELIAAHNQKLEALKVHKKGLMKQLFPTEGETVPKLRFPEFKDSGEWKTGTLGEDSIAIFVSDKMGLKELKLNSYVSTENLLPGYGGKVSATKLPPSGSFTIFSKGDILLSNIRPYLKKIWFADTDGGASNDIIVIRAGLKVSATFLSFILRRDDFIDYIMKSAEGVKMPRGDKDSIKEYPIAFPKAKEQQKIATLLSSLDDLISTQAQKIETLKAHKKGLMQQLFPAINPLDE